ncbi:S8 family serine peptidase [Flavobacterium sp.]|uniref:S8 family serine peptidase n=1 Tax=Flavobacterium sp. TaxID=239 RepID=UPI002B4AC7EE|nr:S8 family serine peptidase [Flavobacterium sp.]HLF53019.1 S8 family serine peptidase [Flavobacterium sp.]
MKQLLLLISFFSSIITFAQEDAWVYFNNKPNAQYYFDNPLQMLSQRALDRRTTQNIPLDLIDIPIHQPYVAQVEAVTDITVFAQSKWMNAVHIRGTESAINSLSLLSFVDHVDFANHSLNTGNKAAKPVEMKVLDTQVNFNYGSSANQIQMLNGHLLHQQNYTGTGKIIAVLDAGFPNVNLALPFKRLRDNNQILGGYNFVGRNTNFYSGNSHGTMVLSTMGGYVDNQLVGTAPDASYYLFITEDVASENPLEESLWVEAAETADSLGVDVINTSLGYFTYDNPAYSYTYADLNGITSFASRGADKAFSRGMIVVVSAGNSGASANPYISVPADAINVLAVGAVNSTEVYASFSSIGPSFDGRVKPDVMAQGQNSVLSNTAGTITTGNGTSFSGPIMAGMIASFWQAFPSFTNTQIIQFVKQSADRFATPNAQYGYGIPDFQLALNNALSIAEFDADEFILYPNPVKDIVTISIPENFMSSTMVFYNNLGQMVLSQKINNQSQNISLESLSSGIYYYTIASAEKTLNGKIIKN